MLKQVEIKSATNVFSFPELHTQRCSFAATCPIRSKLIEQPGKQITSALFAGASHGEVFLNGMLVNNTEDIGPLLEIIGVAVTQLCKLDNSAAVLCARDAIFSIPYFRRCRPPRTI